MRVKDSRSEKVFFCFILLFFKGGKGEEVLRIAEGPTVLRGFRTTDRRSLGDVCDGLLFVMVRGWKLASCFCDVLVSSCCRRLVSSGPLLKRKEVKHRFDSLLVYGMSDDVVRGCAWERNGPVPPFWPGATQKNNV